MTDVLNFEERIKELEKQMDRLVKKYEARKKGKPQDVEASKPKSGLKINAMIEKKHEDGPIPENKKRNVDYLKTEYQQLQEQQDQLLMTKGNLKSEDRITDWNTGSSKADKINDQLEKIAQRKQEIYSQVESIRNNRKTTPKIFDD